MIKDLEILIEMQEFDDQISERQLLMQSLPEELNSLKTGLEEADKTLAETKHNLELNLKDQKLKELKIKENIEKINKYKNQLLTVKTNKEYKALNSEISHLEGKNNEIDDEIIAFMEDEAEIRTALETAIEVQKMADDNLKANEERLKKKIEQVKNEIEEIRTKRNEIAKSIPTRIVKRYAALIKNKGRKAVAFNINNACSGCGFNIRPQVVIEINEGNKINFCENCGRILVYKPESG
jgi:predicted  nucleic acid-binding Zn-ribbon protein